MRLIMTRYIIATFAFIVFTAVAIPAFAAPSDYDLKTNPGVEQMFGEQQRDSN
jgi:hypothetical protein